MTKDIPFDALPKHEQSLEKLTSSVSGNCKMNSVGMEKATSLRLNHNTYPVVKALTILSGNSMNTIINEMLEVAYGVLYEKLDQSDKDALDTQSKAIFHNWYTEELEKNNATDNG